MQPAFVLQKAAQALGSGIPACPCKFWSLMLTSFSIRSPQSSVDVVGLVGLGLVGLGLVGLGLLGLGLEGLGLVGLGVEGVGLVGLGIVGLGLLGLGRVFMSFVCVSELFLGLCFVLLFLFFFSSTLGLFIVSLSLDFSSSFLRSSRYVSL